MSKCLFDCFDPPGTLQPYADIGGPGVIIEFWGTAWFVVVLVILYYLFGLCSTKDPFSTPPEKSKQLDLEHVWVPNHIDHLVLRMSGWLGKKLFGWLMHTKLYTWAAERPRWEHAFTKVLLGKCDVQLLTGTGILLSGYIALSCFISAYHWQLVVYLAWFSNLTHIACLTALRRYLHQHQPERNWRLLFMTVLWAGLIPAMVPTAFFNWPNKEPTSCLPLSNARCFFNLGVGRALFNDTAYFNNFTGSHSDGNSPADHSVTMAMADTSAIQSATVSILLLGFSYLTRIIKLTKHLSDSVRVTIRGRTSDRYTKSLVKVINKIATNPRLSTATRDIQHLFVVKTRIALYLVAKMYADLLTSDASDVYWLVVSAVWGTLRLTETKSSVEVDDSDWGFGQILPVFLLIGPLATAIQAIAPEKKSDEVGDASNQDFAQASNRVVPADDVPVIPDNHAIQQQSDAASQHSSPHDSDRGAAATAQNARSSAENAPAQLAVEAPTAQIEAQVNAQQCARNDTPNVSHVGSEQAVNDDAPTPQEVTQEQLRSQLYAYYADGHFMGPAIMVACLQVLPLTAVIFNHMAVHKMKVVRIITNFFLNIFVVQPVNSFIVVLWGLVKPIDGEVPVVDWCSPRYQRRRRRPERLRWGLSVALLVLNILFLTLDPFLYSLVYSFGMLLFHYGVEVWVTSKRSKGQGRPDTLPVVEVGYELEAVE